jgi:hypothetical protein
MPLSRDEDSPYCYAVSSSLDLLDHPSGVKTNFLATQVWPSARQAARCLQEYLPRASPSFATVCEFGCGPGLPSLTAATCDGVCRVIATDLDSFALKLVQAAATAQDLSGVATALFDLVSPSNDLPLADLYVLSDVFESAAVAQGAADLTRRALEQGSHVWVFAQSDRVQREVYLEELQGQMASSSSDSTSVLTWSSLQDGPPTDGSRLWLCNVDETTVFYG